MNNAQITRADPFSDDFSASDSPGSGAVIVPSPPPGFSPWQGGESSQDPRQGDGVPLDGQTGEGDQDAYSVVTEDQPAEKPSGVSLNISFWPGILLGLLLATALCLVLLRRRKPARNPARPTMKGITVQGVGQRENQQDSVYLSDPGQYAKDGVLLCLADGMGGLSNGQMVSRAAVSAVASKYLSSPKDDPMRLLALLVQSANSAVKMLLSPNYGTGGTTLLVGLLYRGRFYYASVGDSRIGLYRDGKLIHLNRQHVYEDELLLRSVNGEITYDQAVSYEKKGALTSYLGMGNLKYMDLPRFHVPLRRGDRIILMSDGVFNTLSDEEIGSILSGKTEAVPDRLTREVESKHVRYQDNFSAVVVSVGE